jgi:hypothetical protein
MMAGQIQVEVFKQALQQLLEETFDNVHGAYLDKGTSLFETLATVSAEDASRRIAPSCACIAAQVEHVSFYLELVVRFVHGQVTERPDWQSSWQRTSVTPEEWEELKGRLRAAHQGILALVEETPNWDDPRVVGGAIGMVAHTAYHLGEIRQGLGVLKG